MGPQQSPSDSTCPSLSLSCLRSSWSWRGFPAGWAGALSWGFFARTGSGVARYRLCKVAILRDSV